MQIDCPTCRTSASLISIIKDPPDGPSQEHRKFIEQYNIRVFEKSGFITFLENFPFMVHRYVANVFDSCGLTLFTNLYFWIAIVILICCLSETWLDKTLEVLSKFIECLEFTTLFCVVLPLLSHLRVFGNPDNAQR